MPTLILSLPLREPSATPEYDYVLSPDGQQPGAEGRAIAALLPTRGQRGTEVVAVVPAPALSWHRISLPQRVLRSLLSGRSEPARVRSVLSGVLEDQLLDDAERLHFAVFAAEPTAGAAPPEAAEAWVAVCERAWLQAALQQLEAAGLGAGRIVAECTPTAPGSAQVLLDPQQQPAQMLLCTDQGVRLLPLLPATLELALAQPGLEVFAEPAVMALAQTRFGSQASLQTRSQRLLQAAQSPWNLAQLELSASPGGRLHKRLAVGLQQLLQAPQWRPLRWGLLALVLVQVLGLNALAWQQRNTLAQQRAAIQAVLQQTFPEVRLVIDAPAQMQRAVDDLARARGVGADTDAGRLFSSVVALAPAGSTLSSIEWTAQGLQLGAAGGLDAASAQPLISQLAAQGLRASLQDGQLSISPQEARP